MNEMTQLQTILQQQFHWHGARIKFLSLFLVALFRVRTVNLQFLAIAFANDAQTGSNYKRLQRFLRHFTFDYHHWAHVILSLMAIPQPWVLTLDRTNWKVGEVDHNILMLGVVHQGISIPVLWWMLDKRGNSNTLERVLLLEEFRDLFATTAVKYLCADREFLGETWFAYLLSEPAYRFRIRIRETDKMWDERSGLDWTGKELFAWLRPGESKVLRDRYNLWGHWVFVSGLRLQDGDLLIVVTPDRTPNAIRDYAQRWSIETLFGALKSRGFNLEDTDIKDMERLSKLIALLTLALCWAIRTGEWLEKQKPIPIKNHNRKLVSVFRYGLDYIRRLLLMAEIPSQQWSQVLSFLSCT
jgi:hypothetical protein